MELLQRFEFLQIEYYGNSVLTWAVAALMALLAFSVLRIVKSVFIRQLERLAEKTKNRWDDLIIELLHKTKTVVLLIVALYAGTMVLDTSPRVESVTTKALIIAVLLQLAIWADALVVHSIKRLVQKQTEEDVSSVAMITVLGFVSRMAVWSVVVLLVLDNLGFDITALVAGLGIGGVAVALAAQNVLGDLFASISIVLDKPFVVGDFIIVGDLLGSVEYIGIKTTRVRSLSGEQLVFSNNDLLNSRIRNFKRMYQRRVVFQIGVVYQTRHETLAAIPAMLREIVEAHEQTRFDRAHFAKYGDFALIYEIVYHVDSPDYNLYMDIQQAINLEIHRRFEEQGIEFAYPTQKIHLAKD